jgi:hypothetical protein
MWKMKERNFFLIVLSLGALLFAPPALADVYVYPEKGQSKEQQDKDKYECYNWSVQQTGFDPMKQPTATSPPPQQGATQGGVVRGGARGAAAGAVGGAIAGDAGKGAAIGAATGAVIGGMRRRHQQREQDAAEQQWANEQAAHYQQDRANYDRAYGACLQGRGYSVN